MDKGIERIERIDLYDNAKGIGMILVVYGLLFEGGSIPFSIIFSFHMPLFFIISGILFTPPFLGSFRDSVNWLKKVLVKYLTPFVFFSILGGIGRFLLDGNIDYYRVLIELIFFIGSDELMTGALWFIGLLGMAVYLLPYLLKIEKRGRFNRIIILISLAIISYLSDRFSFYLPMRFKSLSAVVLFVYIGYIIKDDVLQWIKEKFMQQGLLILLPIFLFLAVLNRTVNIAIPSFNDFMIYLFCSLYGSLAVLFVSKWKWLKVVNYMGRRSLAIFSVHAFWIAVYVKLINDYHNTDYQPLVDIPLFLIIPGGLIILFMSVITIMLIMPVYDELYKKIRVII